MASAPMASYAASKWAFEALSECLAQEVRAFNVRVAIVEPGVIATPIFGKAPPLPRTASTPTGGGFGPCSPPRSPNRPRPLSSAI